MFRKLSGIVPGNQPYGIYGTFHSSGEEVHRGRLPARERRLLNIRAI